jgi:uncharacterized membrane protein
MTWAEKTVLWVAGLIALSAAALFVILMIGTRMMGAIGMGSDALKYTVYVICAVTLPLWLVLRLIYFFQQIRRPRASSETKNAGQSPTQASSLRPRR